MTKGQAGVAQPIGLRRSLRGRIYALGVFICLSTSGALIISNFISNQDALRQAAERDVAFESRLLARQLLEDYDQLQNDAFTLSKVEAVQGLLRALRNDDVDPVDGSTRAQLEYRARVLFRAIMQARSAYTQVRLIGLDDCGRERIRVNRIAGRLVDVATAKLQRKCARDYFQKGIRLKEGEYFFTAITYNREHGRIEEPRVPTLRVIVPVYDVRARIVGLIVINEDYGALLSRFARSVAIGHAMTIATLQGDFITRSARGRVAPFMFHEDPAYSGLPLPPGLLADRRAVWTSNRDGSLFASARLPAPDGDNASPVVVTLRVPNATLYAPAQQTLRNGLLLSIPLMLLAIVITLAVSVRVMKPLTSMTRSIDHAMRTGSEPDLPTAREDEAGLLARAFAALLEIRRSQQARQVAIIGNVCDAIVSVDQDGCILDFNPAAERLFGYGYAEAAGQPLSMLMSPTGDEADLGEVIEREARRADGTLFPIELSMSEIRMPDGASILTCVLRDISPRKEMEALQNEFISTVNHELRTPLTAIRAALTMLHHRMAGKGDAKADHLLASACQGSERLHELVNDILDLQRLQAGRMNYTTVPCDLAALVGETVERYQALGESVAVKLVLDTAPTRLACAVDPVRFGQALGNLLSNAIKFSPPGGRVRITVRPTGKGTVQVRVADQGPGIPLSFRDKIFTRFAQADGSDARAKSGSGLGLSITKAIVENFSGTIGFESVEGRGATFVIEIPLQGAARQEVWRDAEQARTGPLCRG
ncbi:PAS domain S-box protein [Novosphingobium profundi]|uniref:ATP-binding protein n=1 Tax=Novosphingobium profundi TaxID=1774954 RepID=UPI001BDA474F|nr:ATP-binding protein [Novosphingobium profundi]MBT0669348.1 PAS domain S-box protein [Novosphingobium profundi]